MPFYQLIVTTTSRKHYFSFEIACSTGGLAGSNAKRETAREALDEIFFEIFLASPFARAHVYRVRTR